MDTTIAMDASGRLVLPKAVRQRLNLEGGARLRATVVAGRIELEPVEDEAPALKRVDGLLVIAAAPGKQSDAAAAVRADREDSERRGLRR